MLSITVDGLQKDFLVDTGATHSTVRSVSRGKLSNLTTTVVGISGDPRVLPFTTPLPTVVGDQILLHSYICSKDVPVNLLGRDLLIRLGASITCSPQGLTVSLPAGTILPCREMVEGNGQFLLHPAQDVSPTCVPRCTDNVPAVGPTDVGCVGIPPVTFTLHTSAPLWQSQYPHKPQAEAGIAETIEGLIDAGVLEPSGSPWNTPILPVEKKGTGKYRMVHDLRRINSLLGTTSLPVPNPYVALANLPPSHAWFSCIDLANAFFCLPLAESLRDVFSFTFRGHQWRYTRLPQGFALSPGLFNQHLKAILAKCPLPSDCFLVQYVDDLLLSAPTADVCLQATRSLLTFLAEVGFKVSRSKLQCCHKQVSFLGRMVAQTGGSCERKRHEKPPRTIRMDL
uniref:ribonuclease H n=1 Tax=Denticeps clupeoides TaxID=299321 RepID=A0AAY4DZI5_9TELE